MDLTTATPQEIDQKIAELELDIWTRHALIAKINDSIHRAAGDRQDYYRRQATWRLSDQEVIDKLHKLLENPQEYFLSDGGRAKVEKLIPSQQAARDEIAELSKQVADLEGEFDRRGGWTRFHKLCSTDGARIHHTRWCSGLHRSNLNDLGWHPELSGKSEAEAVALLGPVLCSKCFPSAPADWRRNPADLKQADPNACTGENGSPVEGSVTRQSNWSGVRHYGQCPKCLEVKLLKGGNKLPKHKVPVGK